MTGCPSDLELERRVRAGPGAPHLRRCPRCAARVAELQRLGQEFEREVLPATVEAVVAASAPPRAWARAAAWLAPAAALAAAAAAVLVLRGGEEAGVDRLTLRAYAPEAAGARAVGEGDVVPAGAGLRLEVRPGRSCNLFVVSTDAAGSVSRVFPADGREGVSVEAGGAVAVPGGAALEGRPGPARFFAVCGCGDEPVTWEAVVRAARAVGRGEASVRAARTLSGLPDDALQATLLVERRP